MLGLDPELGELLLQGLLRLVRKHLRSRARARDRSLLRRRALAAVGGLRKVARGAPGGPAEPTAPTPAAAAPPAAPATLHFSRNVWIGSEAAALSAVGTLENVRGRPPFVAGEGKVGSCLAGPPSPRTRLGHAEGARQQGTVPESRRLAARNAQEPCLGW